ncbi:hypothetical protein ACHAW6_005304 [Cyclotella cf. meneghiniana]
MSDSPPPPDPSSKSGLPFCQIYGVGKMGGTSGISYHSYSREGMDEGGQASPRCVSHRFESWRSLTDPMNTYEL